MRRYTFSLSRRRAKIHTFAVKQLRKDSNSCCQEAMRRKLPLSIKCEEDSLFSLKRASKRAAERHSLRAWHKDQYLPAANHGQLVTCCNYWHGLSQDRLSQLAAQYDVVYRKIHLPCRNKCDKCLNPCPWEPRQKRHPFTGEEKDDRHQHVKTRAVISLSVSSWRLRWRRNKTVYSAARVCRAPVSFIYFQTAFFSFTRKTHFFFLFFFIASDVDSLLIQQRLKRSLETERTLSYSFSRRRHFKKESWQTKVQKHDQNIKTK